MILAMDSSVSKISWESFKERINMDTAWTLVHGDYHPANQLIDPISFYCYSEEIKLISLDWEMVGLGSGP